MIRDPRTAFRDSPHQAAHAKLVDTEAFQAACDYALLALVSESPPATNPAASFDAYSQIYGARRVLDILKTLHLSTPDTKPTKPAVLNYRA